MQVSRTFCPAFPPSHCPFLDNRECSSGKDHCSPLASSRTSVSMHLKAQHTPHEAHLHSHSAYATARDAVSSSPVDTDKTLTRSHLSSGIVDERQTHVWPDIFESAQTRVMSPSRDNDCSQRVLISDWNGQQSWTTMNQPALACKRQQATTVQKLGGYSVWKPISARQR